MLTVNYQFKGENYNGRLTTGKLSKDDIGKDYFVMLLPSNPNAIVLLENNPVPDCLLNKAAPPQGWKKMPTCN